MNPAKKAYIEYLKLTKANPSLESEVASESASQAVLDDMNTAASSWAEAKPFLADPTWRAENPDAARLMDELDLDSFYSGLGVDVSS